MMGPQEDKYKRVILHLDLDCFYAQVEHNRLGIPMSIPLAVQQWNGLIAVNYAARDSGVKRHTPVAEALLKCPQLRLVHVPTYSVAAAAAEDEEIVAVAQYRDEMPAYRSDGTRLPPNPPDPASNKACLEPYRHASMSIFRLIRDWCSQHNEGIRMEKGGLDEVFLDISEEVEERLIEEFDQKYTMLRDELEEAEADIVEENLKLYDITWIDRLDYTGLGESANTKKENKESSDDEDIVEAVRMKLGKLRIWKGAHLAASLRSRLRLDLNFIASIGIASNKMLAKLASAIHKPDRQTRIEPQAVGEFMRRVPFDKIRMMGGKMGKSVLKEDGGGDSDKDDENDEDEEDDYLVSDHVDTPVMASDLWNLSIAQLADRVGDRQTAAWIHQLIRGNDTSPVTPRSLAKSFMSAKSFRPAVRDWPELHDWVVVLVGELWSRMGEERENSGRWPSSIVVHFKSFSKSSRTPASSTWSNAGAITKSCEFPYSSSIPSQATRSHFLSAVFKLFTTIAAGNDSLFPMSRLAVSVTNFKGLEADGKAKATRVDHFFKKQSEGVDSVISPGLERFFPEQQPQSKAQIKKPSSTLSVLEMLKASANKTNTKREDGETPSPLVKRKKSSSTTTTTNNGILKYFSKSSNTDTSDDNNFTCTERNCNFKCPRDSTKSIQEHSDHHLAMKLALEP